MSRHETKSEAAFDQALGRALDRVAELRAAGKTRRAGTLFREITHAVVMRQRALAEQ